MRGAFPTGVRRQVTEPVRSGTRAKQLAETFGMSTFQPVLTQLARSEIHPPPAAIALHHSAISEQSAPGKFHPRADQAMRSRRHLGQ